MSQEVKVTYKKRRFPALAQPGRENTTKTEAISRTIEPATHRVVAVGSSIPILQEGAAMAERRRREAAISAAFVVAFAQLESHDSSFTHGSDHPGNDNQEEHPE